MAKKVYTEDERKKLIDRAFEELEKRNLSGNKANLLFGISGSVLSGLKTGNYKGDQDGKFEILERYFEASDYSAKAPREDGYKPTSISEEVYERIRNCKNKGGMAVACGDAGIGKTQAALKFLHDEPERTIYIAVNPCVMSSGACLKQVARKLNIKSKRNDELWYEIVNAIPDKTVIIFDEAQFLTMRTIEVFRAMMDLKKQEGCTLGVMFIGNRTTSGKIKGDSCADFAQIANRTRFPATFSTKDVKKDDILLLFPQYAGKEREIEFLHRVAKSREGIRNTVQLVLEAQNIGRDDYEGLIDMAKFMQLTI